MQSPATSVHQRATAVSDVPPGQTGGLPLFLTSFVGRVDEIELATSLLDRPGQRLLTLTGPGGIGKTRLAVEIAASIAADGATSVCFAALASVEHPSLVMPTIGAALGQREIERDAALDTVAAAIGSNRLLLVVDNFEHLLDAAPMLTSLLAKCPRLTIIATSRSLLRLEGEQALPVPPLALPPSESARSIEEWMCVPVVRLFIERSNAIDPARVWTAEDVRQVVAICGRLDGLPLAVELAATRLRHLSLAEIRDRLDARLTLLTGGSRDHPTRLQTMRAAIAWSYDLLAPSQQVLFRRLAVCPGGCTRDTIERIAGQLDDGSPELAEELAELIDASLLVREVDPLTGGARYRMLETIRDYAWEQLAQSGELEATRQAHAVAFMQFAERHELADLLPSSAHAIERLVSERANLDAALTWLDTARDTDGLLRLISALGNFWNATADYRQATSWYERVLAENAVESDPLRAKIQVNLGMTRLLQGELAGAEPVFESGLATCRAAGEPYYAALALLGLANVAALQGEHELGADFLRAGREAAEAIPDQRLSAIVQGMVSLNLAVVSRARGELDLAGEQIADMLRRARAADYLQGTLIALIDLGDLARDRADWSGALACYREALKLGIDRPIKRATIETIEAVAIVAFRLGQADRSALLAGAAEALRERTGLRYIQPESSTSLELAIQGSRAILGDSAFATAWEAGRTCSAGEAIAIALAVQVHMPAPGSERLTPRETEIARLLVLGMTDPEIADTLFISVRTVENHVAHILAKLGVHTRTAAATIASGLFAPESA
jgi:non-specific serine/threonine protein kinase